MNVIIAETKRGNVYAKYLNPERYETLADYVGDYFQNEAPAELSQRNIALIVNANALIEGDEPNDNLYPFFYLGICVFCGIAWDGEYIGLTVEQHEFVTAWLRKLAKEN